MDKITDENPLYRGHAKAAGGWLVRRFTSLNDSLGEKLEHHVLHSPDGFAWGYGGSGPSELARCLLIDALGVQKPHPALYQDFKDAFVSRWPDSGDWCIDAETIRRWVVGWTAKMPTAEILRDRNAAALGIVEPVF